MRITAYDVLRVKGMLLRTMLFIDKLEEERELDSDLRVLDVVRDHLAENLEHVVSLHVKLHRIEIAREKGDRT